MKYTGDLMKSKHEEIYKRDKRNELLKQPDSRFAGKNKLALFTINCCLKYWLTEFPLNDSNSKKD